MWTLSTAYAAFVPLVGVVGAPWSLFATVRLLGGSRVAALLGGLLALAPGDVYFWWFMAHGTLPAMISAFLAPLAIALAWRVFARHDHRWTLVAALTVVLIVGLFWVLFVLMIGPALLMGAAICRRRLCRRDLVLAAVVAAAVLLVHSHWLLALLGSPQIGYIAPEGLGELTWRKFFEDSLQPVLFDPNPIALVLGVVGVFLLPGPLRAVYGGFVASLLIHATVIHRLFERLELDRFLVPFTIALVPPAAWLGTRLHPRRRPRLLADVFAAPGPRAPRGPGAARRWGLAPVLGSDSAHGAADRVPVRCDPRAGRMDPIVDVT